MNATLADILWYLAIGALFFMMMRRGGCCGGHSHNHSHKEQKPTADQPKELTKP
jgi:hypothetical protein